VVMVVAIDIGVGMDVGMDVGIYINKARSPRLDGY
jgi:hypothetical protein